MSLLRLENDGSVVHLTHSERCNVHNSASPNVGARGLASIDERKSLEEMFTTNANKAPRQALRERKLAHPDEARPVKLNQAQDIKKVVMRTKLNAKKIGELEKVGRWAQGDPCG